MIANASLREVVSNAGFTLIYVKNLLFTGLYDVYSWNKRVYSLNTRVHFWIKRVHFCDKRVYIWNKRVSFR